MYGYAAGARRASTQTNHLQASNYLAQDGWEEEMLKRNETVLWRELDGEAVLLDAAAGCTYHLNRVGTLIWNLLDGRHTAGEIASAICEAFEVEQEQALHDMQRLVDELRQQQLLQSDGPLEIGRASCRERA